MIQYHWIVMWWLTGHLVIPLDLNKAQHKEFERLVDAQTFIKEKVQNHINCLLLDLSRHPEIVERLDIKNASFLTEEEEVLNKQLLDVIKVTEE